jgi:hypothetical protein
MHERWLQFLPVGNNKKIKKVKILHPDNKYLANNYYKISHKPQTCML